MPYFAAINCFNAGELSPKMLGRSDVQQYSKGCQTLQNYLVTPYGAVERRPGSRFVAEAKYPNRKVRLIRFVFSSTISYVCEFGHLYIRFFKDDAPVLKNGSILEIVSPYTENDLGDIQFVQSADVMTIVHGSYSVRELKRIAENDFTLTEKEYKYPPVLDPNLDDEHTITPSGVDVDASITLTANKDTFTSGNVGGFFQLIHVRKENEIAKDFKADGTSDTLEVFGYWTFTTHGTWTGTLKIQRSYDNGASWKDFRSYSAANDSNTSTSGTEEDDNVLYRLKMEDYQQSSTGTLKLCRCLFSNPDFTINGVVKITSVTDTKHADAVVKRKLGGNTATNEWNEGAWSTRRGFPRTISFFEERMIFGGNAARPQTVWGSRTNSWDDFLLGDKDDDGIEFMLASDTVNTICWLCQHDALVIGTMDSEWTLSSADAGAALTPSNFRVRRQSVYGSTNVTASMVGDTILFVQRGGRKVREFVYQWEKDGYVSPDMTILADHITASGVKECALQQLPDSILWCVLNNGAIAALTYERDQEVVGWHRHETQGAYLSVCVIPDGNEDKIYFAVQRNGKRLIEVMAPRNFTSVSDIYFVDSGVAKTANNAFTTVENLAHLAGMQVQILADGAVQGEKTVPASGVVTLDEPAKSAVVGLGFDSILSPMPVEIETQNGQSILRNKIVGELRCRVYNSVGGEVKCGKSQWQKIVSRDVLADYLDQPITLKNEVVTLNVLAGYSKSADITIKQSDPLPSNVNSIVVIYEVVE